MAVLLVLLPSRVSLGVDGQSHQLEAHRGREVVGLVQLSSNIESTETANRVKLLEKLKKVVIMFNNLQLKI